MPPLETLVETVTLHSGMIRREWLSERGKMEDKSRDILSEWLRRQTRNLLGFARAGSNPADVAFLPFLFLPVIPHGMHTLCIPNSNHPVGERVESTSMPSSRSHPHTTHESTHYTTLHRNSNPISPQCSSHRKMPNESEFETVISEADVEAGVMPIPQANANAQQAGAPAPAPASSGWSLASLSGLQKVVVN